MSSFLLVNCTRTPRFAFDAVSRNCCKIKTDETRYAIYTHFLTKRDICPP